MTVFRSTILVVSTGVSILLFVLATISIREEFAVRSLLKKGYYVTPNPYAVAVIAAEKQDAKECTKIRFGYSFTQTQESAINNCIVETARLVKDPTVCDLINSRDRRSYCIGEVSNAIKPERECYLKNNMTMLCTMNNRQYEFPWKDCSTTITDTEMKNWCVIARVTWDPSYDRCDGLSTNEVHIDACYSAAAQKHLDSKKCLLIRNATRRSACKIRVESKSAYVP